MTLPDDHTINTLYRELAENVVNELNRPDLTKIPNVRYDTGKRLIIIREPDGKEKAMSPGELRYKCSCALCVDEFTGKRLNKVLLFIKYRIKLSIKKYSLIKLKLKEIML